MKLIQEKNLIKLAKYGLAGYLASLYAFTGVDGVLLFIIMFLVGIPLEERLKPIDKT